MKLVGGMGHKQVCMDLSGFSVVCVYVTGTVRTIPIPILQELYSESHENVCVMFASISGWDDYYDQTGINDSGMECLRLLNEIMWDFDEVRSSSRG